MDPIKGRTDPHGQLVREIVEGRRRLHELPEHLAPEQAAEIRRRAAG